GAEEISAASEVGVANRAEALQVHVRQRTIGRFPLRAQCFLFRQFNQAIEMPRVAVLQERIEQHRAKRGRQRQGEAGLHSVPQPAVHDLKQRDVAFRDGLEKPVFLQKLFVFRVADKRQVRVKDQSEVTLHECGGSELSISKILCHSTLEQDHEMAAKRTISSTSTSGKQAIRAARPAIRQRATPGGRAPGSSRIYPTFGG